MSHLKTQPSPSSQPSTQPTITINRTQSQLKLTPAVQTHLKRRERTSDYFNVEVNIQNIKIVDYLSLNARKRPATGRI